MIAPMRCAGTLVVILSLGLAGCPASPPPPRDGALVAGVATVPLDAPIGTAMGGYGRKRTASDPGSPWASQLPASRGIHTAPTARALVLQNGRRAVAAVRLDLIFVTATLRSRAEARLRDRLGDVGLRLFLFATHTHAAPARIMRPVLIGDSTLDAAAFAMDRYDAEVEDRIAGSTAEAIVQALARSVPVSVGVGSANLPEDNADRRCQNDDLYGPDFRDTAITVVRFDEVDAARDPVKPFAAIVHYAMHGTELGGENTLFSTDAPGAIEQAAGDRLGVPFLYLQGPAGDVANDSGPLGHVGLQGIERIGAIAAPRVAEAFGKAAPGPAPEAMPLEFVESAVPFSRDDLGYAPDDYPEWGAVNCGFGAPSCQQLFAGPEMACLPIARDRYRIASVAALRLGGLFIGVLPGEPTTAIGARVRELAAGLPGVDRGLAAGYAQDYTGYLLEEADFLRGGYEPTVSLWGWKGGPYLVGKLRALAADLAAATHRPPEIPTPTYEPRRIGESATAPATEVEPDDVDRLQTAWFAFTGGDPALGAPRVAVERLEGPEWVEPRLSPQRTLAGGPEIVLRHAPSPTYVEDPEAAVRNHRYTAEWETVQGERTATYRFAVSGRVRGGGELRTYALASRPFQVRPSDGVTARPVDAEVRADGMLAVRFRYPPHPPRFAEGGDPIANYRMRDAFAAPADGAVVRGGGADVTVSDGTAAPVTVRLSYAEAAGAFVGAPAPLAGATWTVQAAPGAVVDAFGNRNGQPIRLDVKRP